MLHWLRVEGGQLPQRACNHICWRLLRYVWDAATLEAEWPWAVLHLLSLEAARHLCSSCCSDGHTYYAYTCYAYTCYAYTCYAYTHYGVPGRRSAGARSASSRRVGGRSIASLCGLRTRERNAKPSGSSLASTP